MDWNWNREKETKFADLQCGQTIILIDENGVLSAADAEDAVLAKSITRLRLYYVCILLLYYYLYL